MAEVDLEALSSQVSPQIVLVDAARRALQSEDKERLERTPAQWWKAALLCCPHRSEGERMHPVEFDAVVRSIYRAACDETPWTQTLHQVSHLIGGGGFCQFVAIEKRTARLALCLHSSEAPMEGVLDYLREFHRLDPHVAHAVTIAQGDVFNTADLISAQQARSLPFYRQFWSVYDVGYATMSKVFEDDSLTALIGVFRSANVGPYSEEQDQLLRRIGSFAGDAFQLMRKLSRLRRESSVGNFILDRIGWPAVLIDAQRHIVHANKAAAYVLDRSGILRSRAGFLDGGTSASSAVLNRELSKLELTKPPAANVPDRRAFALQASDGSPVPACLWALHPSSTMGAFSESPVALLMLPANGKKGNLDATLLAASFNLTPAEGKVLSLLAQDLELREVADALRIAVTTARSHLRSIFSKTGIRNQKSLLRQVDAIFQMG